MRKVEFSNLGVTFIFETPDQDNIEVRKNNRPVPLPIHLNDKFQKHDDYVSKFRLVDTSKPSDQTQKMHKIRLEVRYKQARVNAANDNSLELGIHNGVQWLLPGQITIIKKYEIDDRSNKWYGSWLVEVDLPADPMVAWGP
ncbi:MAG: hypothetical protein KAI06_09025 [Anaerolineales bacterium]|nr:hypothetical protein [Anaerolineales bacterium]